MKKILILSLMTFLLTGIKSHAETIQTILLLHEGTGTSFAFDKLQDAVNAAVAGDTICLNEGTYPLVGDTLTINKAISIVGCGYGTRLMGSINIAIPGDVALTAYMLDALWVTADVTVSQPVSGLRFRKVTFDAALVWNAETKDVQLDRCYVNNIWHSSPLKSATMMNCKIFQETVPDKDYPGYGDNLGSSITFINCSIYLINHLGYVTEANNYSEYINCIINYIGGDWGHDINDYMHNTTIINSLISRIPTLDLAPPTMKDCYFYEEKFGEEYPNQDTWRNNDNGFFKTNDELIATGCVGTDGTVVGCSGGQAPYTLVPNGISVKDSRFEIDRKTKQLKVTLKLTAN